MIVSSLIGGLGNQLFQYAFARSLSLRFGHDLFFDDNVYKKGYSNRPYALDIFSIEANFARSLSNLLDTSKLTCFLLDEPSFEYLELGQDLCEILDMRNEQTLVLVRGYWQSPLYFKTIQLHLRNELAFKNELIGKFLEMSQMIRDDNAVMVNVRRGDYLTKLDYHGVVTSNYIEKAILYLEGNLTQPVFYIFSDDINWCKKNLPENKVYVFLNEEYYDYKFENYLHLMTKCKHFVISNSTFAWWAAWLGTNKDKIVVAPKKWFQTTAINIKDLFPPEWILI